MMKKRIISLLLAIPAVICMLLSGALTAAAVPVPSRTDEPEITLTVNEDGKHTTITVRGAHGNNVINWQSFDIGENDTIIFDDGNYLNIVNDDHVSKIDGKISGGENIHIVNPNGVLFGSSSTVDCGNLYLSACVPAAIDTDQFQNGGNPFTGSPDGLTGDIVNLGAIKADQVYIEGSGVYLSGTAVGGISSDKITVISDGVREVPGTGSVLSAGDPWMVIAIAAAAVFGAGGFFLGTVIEKEKKIPVPAAGIPEESQNGKEE